MLTPRSFAVGQLGTSHRRQQWQRRMSSYPPPTNHLPAGSIFNKQSTVDVLEEDRELLPQKHSGVRFGQLLFAPAHPQQRSVQVTKESVSFGNSC